MAKEKKGKSKAQLATETAREVLKDAKTKLVKQENDANKKSVANAKAIMKASLEVENRERFTKLGAYRFGKILVALDILSNVANSKGYKYDKEDIEEGFKAVEDKLKTVRQMFDVSLAPTAKAEGEGKPAFSFSKK